MQKRGQVTVFIILGIIIGVLLTLVGLMLLNDVSIEVQIGDKINETE